MNRAARFSASLAAIALIAVTGLSLAPENAAAASEGRRPKGRAERAEMPATMKKEMWKSASSIWPP